MSKKVEYTGRDFNSLKSLLEQFGEQYFPNVFNNFNDFSPETMFIEMMAFVGDNLNFNIDENFRNNFLKHSDEIESVFRLAKDKGYKPQTVSVAVGAVELSQLVPAIQSGSAYVPDTSYAGVVESGTLFSNFSQSSRYELIESVDMSEYKEGEEEIVEVGVGDVPEYFRIYADGKVRSGIRKSKELTVGDLEKNLELLLDTNVAFVESIVDADGNTWYEVNYMAQDTIFESIPSSNTSEFSSYIKQTPNQLRAKRVARRFVVDHKSDGKCYLQFGQGIDLIDDTIKGLSTDDFITTNEISNFQLNNTFIVDNFLNNSSFGLAPSNTVLTVNYVVGQGEAENAKPNSVTNISSPNITFSGNVNNDVRNSFAVNNTDPISGASFLNNLGYLKNNVIEFQSEQNRCVTVRDYIIRTKLLPNKFGHIYKVFAEKDEASKSINLHVLSKGDNGIYETSNELTKNNLRNYLEEFKSVGDEINLRNAFIVNIGVYFEYVVRNDFNESEVGRNISRRVEDYFDRDKWEINQPILLDDLRDYISNVDGLVSINNITIENKYNTDDGYSGIRYSVSKNGVNYDSTLNIIYPPADPAIFELKFPRKDIKSRAK